MCLADPPPPPRTARQFDDVPLSVVFGEPVSQNRGPRLDSPCRLFAGLGFLPLFAENLDVLIAKTLENHVFFDGNIGEQRGNARKCKEMRGGNRKST